MDLLLNHFWEFTITGLAFGAVYALIALGYTLVYGVLRLINFAHSEIFMVGVFASLFAMHAMGIEQGDPAKTGFVLVGVLLLVTLAGMLMSGATAVVMERIAYRPLRKRKAPRLAFLITAIGISLTLQVFLSRPGIASGTRHERTLSTAPETAPLAARPLPQRGRLFRRFVDGFRYR